jgi:hypothetical protein
VEQVLEHFDFAIRVIIIIMIRQSSSSSFSQVAHRLGFRSVTDFLEVLFGSVMSTYQLAVAGTSRTRLCLQNSVKIKILQKKV